MKISDESAAYTYLREHYERTTEAGHLPLVRSLASSSGHYQFAVYWPTDGRRAIVVVGPRGGLFVTASFTPELWAKVRELWP